MSALRIGIVAEGSTDQVVLKELLTAYFRHRAPDRVPEFHNLQPGEERNFGIRDGGWTQVYKWCLRNPPQERHGLFTGRKLFAGAVDSQSCDVVVVHLDADICEKIGAKSPVTPVPTPESTPEERGKFIRDTLWHWLWPEGSTPDDRHFPAPAVEAVEAWLVAGLTDDPEPEANRDILRRLAEADFALRGKPVPDEARQVQKKPGNYQRLAQHAAPNVTRIAQRCPHFAALACRLHAHTL